MYAIKCLVLGFLYFQIACGLESQQVNITTTTTDIPMVQIINDLGPSAVQVIYGSAVQFQIVYYAGDNETLESFVASQPTQATVTPNSVTLNLVGEGNIDIATLGAVCKVENFSLDSAKPPCEPWRFTPSHSFSAPSGAQKGATVLVTVPPQVTICINTYCASPLYYALPDPSPKEFTDMGNGIIYDAKQGLMWHANILPGDYPYKSPYDMNFDSINRGAADCAATGLGGFNDWRIPTRSELHRMMDLEVGKPAQNTTLFPDPDGNMKDVALWTSIRTKVDDYHGIYFMIYGGDGGITYNGDVDYSPLQRVRCVRTVINKVALERWQEISEAVALDKQTGLQWHRSYNSTLVPAEQGPFSSINYCQSLSTDNKNDWRLPNSKELASFMDETRAGPAWTVALFPTDENSNSFFWCSNNDWAFGANYYWAMSAGDGVVYVNVSPAVARCVRGPDFDTTPVEYTIPRDAANSGSGDNAETQTAAPSNSGTIAGAVVGTIAGVALLAGVGYYVYTKKSEEFV